jgi:hypothetical protein
MRMLLVIALSLLLGVASCGPLGRGGDVGPVASTAVVVENHNFHQATIYALVNSSRIRLGEVPGNGTATFATRTPATGQLSIEIRLLAVGAYTSFPISVAPGDTVRVRVPSDLHLHRGRPR